MKKDIPQYKVEDLAIAILPDPEDNSLWECYIINFREESISNVLINSKGYGNLDGSPKKTTILRHYFEHIGPTQAQLIEPIHSSLFELTNEFWVSFTLNGYMYDKKYVFVKGSINSEHFTKIPYLDKEGVMIR